MDKLLDKLHPSSGRQPFSIRSLVEYREAVEDELIWDKRALYRYWHAIRTGVPTGVRAGFRERVAYVAERLKTKAAALELEFKLNEEVAEIDDWIAKAWLHGL
jgi:hypothetical protein